MKDNSLVIETNVELAKSFVESIVELISRKFGVKFSDIKINLNAKLIGGILVTFADYKILLTQDMPNISSDMLEQKLIIESARELSDAEKTAYIKFARAKLNLKDEVKVDFNINSNIIGGIKIRYQDEELNLTIDHILDQAFSNI